MHAEKKNYFKSLFKDQSKAQEIINAMEAEIIDPKTFECRLKRPQGTIASILLACRNAELFIYPAKEIEYKDLIEFAEKSFGVIIESIETFKKKKKTPVNFGFQIKS